MQAFDDKFETNRLLHAADLPVAQSFVLSGTTRANVCALADVAEACRSRDMSFPLTKEMRAMLGDVLRFAWDERHAGHVTVDLGSVLDALVDDLASAGLPVTIDYGPCVLVRGDPAGLRRLFANLVDNAVRYGHAAHVDWQLGKDAVTVHIDDHGPGFNPALGDRLFEPFMRGDPSRNRATGGTGLGLAIVRSLTEAHGGRVTLCHGEHGGRVEVMLPHV